MSAVVVNATGPGFVIPTLTDKSSLYITYVTMGVILMTENSMFLATVIYRWKYAKKWPLIFGMFAANICNGLRNFIYGIVELVLIHNGAVDEPFSNWNCMLTLKSSMWIIGTSLPATFQLLIGFERVTAIVAFQWFSVHWNHVKLWIVTGISYVCTATVFLIPAWWLAFGSYFLTTKECVQAIILNYYVTSAVIWYSISASVVGVGLTVSALIVGRTKLIKSKKLFNRPSGKFGKEVRLTGQLTALALLDLALVTIPTILGTLTAFGIQMPPEIGNYNAVFGSIYCCLNMCIYVFTHKDFRLLIVEFFKHFGNSVLSLRSHFVSRVHNGNV